MQLDIHEPNRATEVEHGEEITRTYQMLCSQALDSVPPTLFDALICQGLWQCATGKWQCGTHCTALPAVQPTAGASSGSANWVLPVGSTLHLLGWQPTFAIFQLGLLSAT